MKVVESIFFYCCKERKSIENAGKRRKKKGKEGKRRDKNRMSTNEMPELEVRKLMFTGRIARINDKTVFNFLKICKNDLRKMRILKK
ncbi:hypothetical protein FXV91_03250 [Methanosarcina sp. DH2]|uniref:hypothetical protein n=1 Tax=Methanosarcina sp. DH2 TaxID=2605639 RepID=UPI001E4A72FF|nr:hypothetical protein [Methanosarcina sp. DH2]MCC4769256.1 hypothetical protein [Methanosarcina sp. DH2]